MAKNRLEPFSDGVFAIAATLLVLEIHVPVPPAEGGLAALAVFYALPGFGAMPVPPAQA